MSYTVSVLIATKDRPAELREAITSLLHQSMQPLEIIVMDQSVGGESARVIRETSPLGATASMIYIHDCSISGASAGRNRAMEHATGAIWLFMDDDVVLEPDFVEQLLEVYRRYPDIAGVCGAVTNYTTPSLSNRLWSGLFVWGPFHDERQPIYWNAHAMREAKPIRVQKFGTGMASFRAEAIKSVRFDLHPAAFGAEDVDFCLRLPTDSILLIAPRARCVHKKTSSARPREHWLRTSSRSTCYLYRKHWRAGMKNRICFCWLQVGYILAALAGSIRRLSFEPWRALLDGIRLAPSLR